MLVAGNMLLKKKEKHKFRDMKSIRIHPATFVFFIILAITGYAKILIPSLLAVLLHELGHAFIAKKLGYKLNKIYILPYGASISFEDFAFEPADEVKIALAGPITNLFLILFCVALWWIFPESYLYSYYFVVSNFSVAIFNLLPAFPLDGARVLIGILSLKNKRYLAYKIATMFNFFISLTLLALFALSIFVSINFSFGVMAVFLFLGIIDGKFQGKYSPSLYEFSFSNKKDISQIKSIYVKTNTPLYKIMAEMNKHKYNLIYLTLPNGKLKVIDERIFENLCISNSPKSSLKDCLKFE